jgi:hypothetical protein
LCVTVLSKFSDDFFLGFLMSRNLMKIKVLAFATTLLTFSVNAVAKDLLLWPVDGRETPIKAEQESARWVQFLVEKGRSESISVVLPSEFGVGPLFYPQLIQGQSIDDALQRSAAGTGNGAAVLVQLNDGGINWRFIKEGVGQNLRTSVTSDGLSLGVSWLKMQLDLEAGPVIEELSTANTIAQNPSLNTLKTESIETQTIDEPSAQQAPAAAPVISSVVTAAPVLPTPSADIVSSNYQHSGHEISVTGLSDLSSLLRVTGKLRETDGIKYLYVSQMNEIETRLVVGSDLGLAELSARLAEKPWLEESGIDAYQYKPFQLEEPATLEALLEPVSMGSEANPMPEVSLTPSIDEAIE